MPIRNNLQALILGGQGKGKSSMARLMFAAHAMDENRDNYIYISSKPDAIDPPIPQDGKPVYEIFLMQLGFEPFAVDDAVIEEGFDIEQVIDNYPRSLICLKGTSPQGTDSFMSDLGDVVLDIGSSVLLVDEAERFLPSRRRHPEGLLDLIRRGRYRAVDLIVVSHTDTALHHEVLENSNFLVAFGMKSPTRIERLRHWLDDPNVLAELQPFEYILVDEVGHKKIRRFSTQDFDEFREVCPEAFIPVPRSEVLARCPNLYTK